MHTFHSTLSACARTLTLVTDLFGSRCARKNITRFHKRTPSLTSSGVGKTRLASSGTRCICRWLPPSNASKEEKDEEKANKVAQQVRRASALTAELEAQSKKKKVSGMCSHPPGLHDEPAAKHGVWPSVTSNPFSLADAATASSPVPATQSFLSASKSFFNLGGGFRGARPRPVARAPEEAALVEETLSFHVKANGSDEAPMRQQLKNKKRVELRRTRDL